MTSSSLFLKFTLSPPYPLSFLLILTLHLSVSSSGVLNREMGGGELPKLALTFSSYQPVLRKMFSMAGKEERPIIVRLQAHKASTVGITSQTAISVGDLLVGIPTQDEAIDVNQTTSQGDTIHTLP